jgi:hypothetical protein
MSAAPGPNKGSTRIQSENNARIKRTTIIPIFLYRKNPVCAMYGDLFISSLEHVKLHYVNSFVNPPILWYKSGN